MAVAAGPKVRVSFPSTVSYRSIQDSSKLAAAVTNSGGIGVIGGIRTTPKTLQGLIDQVKEHLEDKDAPFGVDLLIPQVGGNARKTNAS